MQLKNLAVSVPLRGKVNNLRNVGNDTCVVTNRNSANLIGTTQGLFPTIVNQSFTKILKLILPLRGVGCFEARARKFVDKLKFQSPCGVWVVSICSNRCMDVLKFQSPCGVWVVSKMSFKNKSELLSVSVPLRGVGCF